MAKYIIKWNAGYGDSYDVVEAADMDEANRIAYEAWREDAENQADYEAMEHTDEREEELM